MALNKGQRSGCNWFEQPLHGVVCRPWCDALKLKHELHVVEGPCEGAGAKLLWQGRQQGQRFQTQTALYKSDKGYTLKIDCQGKGTFHIEGDRFNINWQSGGTPASHYFQSMGLALWLELQGTLCLHGNALTKDGRTVVLIAPSGTGKSTLSGALMQQGYDLLTDDMVALHGNDGGYDIFPSWPVMRLWPDSIEHVGKSQALNTKREKVHDAFNKRLVSLNRHTGNSERKRLTDIVLLNRVDDVDTGNIEKAKENTKQKESAIKARTLNGSEAVMALLKNTILGEVYRSLAIEDERLMHLAEVAQRVRVSELTYPSGIQGLQTASQWFATT